MPPLTFVLRDDAAVPSRADVVLSRIRDTPPGFVRAYGDVSPGAPRFAGTVLAGTDDPTVPWHRIVRADGSLARGPASGRCWRRRACRFAGSGSTCG